MIKIIVLIFIFNLTSTVVSQNLSHLVKTGKQLGQPQLSAAQIENLKDSDIDLAAAQWFYISSNGKREYLKVKVPLDDIDDGSLKLHAAEFVPEAIVGKKLFLRLPIKKKQKKNDPIITFHSSGRAKYLVNEDELLLSIDAGEDDIGRVIPIGRASILGGGLDYSVNIRATGWSDQAFSINGPQVGERDLNVWYLALISEDYSKYAKGLNSFEKFVKNKKLDKSKAISYLKDQLEKDADSIGHKEKRTVESLIRQLDQN